MHGLESDQFMPSPRGRARALPVHAITNVHGVESDQFMPSLRGWARALPVHAITNVHGVESNQFMFALQEKNVQLIAKERLIPTTDKKTDTGYK